MASPEERRRTVERYVLAYEQNDRDSFLELWAPDAELVDPVGTPAHVGLEAIGAFWDGVHGMADKIVLEPTEIICAGEEAAMIFRINAIMGDGGMQIDAVDVFEFADDGRFTRMKAYWDMGAAKPL
jgi:steroid delta-isomerase